MVLQHGAAVCGTAARCSYLWYCSTVQLFVVLQQVQLFVALQQGRLFVALQQVQLFVALQQGRLFVAMYPQLFVAF